MSSGGCSKFPHQFLSRQFFITTPSLLFAVMKPWNRNNRVLPQTSNFHIISGTFLQKSIGFPVILLLLIRCLALVERGWTRRYPRDDDIRHRSPSRETSLLLSSGDYLLGRNRREWQRVAASGRWRGPQWCGVRTSTSFGGWSCINKVKICFSFFNAQIRQKSKKHW